MVFERGMVHNHNLPPPGGKCSGLSLEPGAPAKNAAPGVPRRLLLAAINPTGEAAGIFVVNGVRRGPSDNASPGKLCPLRAAGSPIGNNLGNAGV